MKNLLLVVVILAALGLALVVLLLVPGVAALPRRAWVATSSGRALPPPAEENAAQLLLPLREPRILISKAERRLRLYSEGKLVRTYPIGLGFAPEGDKERQGDGRTPEGEFYVCTKNERSRYYRALGLSYPGREDAARGLRERIITQRQHDLITDAIRRGARPPWDTRLGGEIMIHGNGARSDWTLGCIALEDAEMRELFDAVPLGTPVAILR